MDDFRDLDRMLADTPMPIPEQAVNTVSPWPAALKKILWGLALNAITINRWNLQTILPMVGVALAWLGWRSLRSENPWLRRGWLASLALLAKRFVVCVLRATPLMRGWEWGWIVLTVLNLVLLVSQYLCLWLGLRAVFQKAGQPPKTGAAFGLLVWYLAILSMALLAPEAGNLVVTGMMLGYLGLIWAMWKTAKSLDQAGYALEPALVKLPAKRAVTALALALGVSIVACMLVFARFPEQKAWKVHTVQDSQRPAEMVELDKRLLGMGYPEELLADLSVEDRAKCLTAVGVDLNYGATSYNSYAWDAPGLLRLQIVSVVLEDGTCRVFNHFQWEEEPEYRGMESLEIVPVFQDVGVRWDDVSTRLLYQQNGRAQETQFASVTETHGPAGHSWRYIFLSKNENGEVELHTPVESSWGSTNFGKIVAEFSLPKDGYRMRGYVAYDLIQDSGEWVYFNMGVNYARTMEPWVYPWKSPVEYRRPWGIPDGRPFQDAPYSPELSMNDPNDPAWQALTSEQD